MEADSWSRFSRFNHHHQSRHDNSTYNLGFEEIHSDGGGEEDYDDVESRSGEFPCPFCFLEFDIIGLCCHIDNEHPIEANNGVCPVCEVRFGMDMVGHITTQHGNFFKIQRRKRYRRGYSDSHSTLSLLRKELREENLQSLIGGSFYSSAPSNAALDPLLSSLICTFPVADLSSDVQPESMDEKSTVSKSSDEKAVESVEPSLSDKHHEERTQRSKFVQELMLSTILDCTL